MPYDQKLVALFGQNLLDRLSETYAEVDVASLAKEVEAGHRSGRIHFPDRVLSSACSKAAADGSRRKGSTAVAEIPSMTLNAAGTFFPTAPGSPRSALHEFCIDIARRRKQDGLSPMEVSLIISESDHAAAFPCLDQWMTQRYWGRCGCRNSAESTVKYL